MFPTDFSTLDEYDQHGRIRGTPPDHATDQATCAYVASYFAGRNVLLMATDSARCQELSAPTIFWPGAAAVKSLCTRSRMSCS